jgi:hypothetical protein
LRKEGNICAKHFINGLLVLISFDDGAPFTGANK